MDGLLHTRGWGLLKRMLLVAALLTAAGGLAACEPPQKSVGPVLATNKTLTVNQYLLSPSGKWKAILQPDGNFVLYGPSGAAWSIGTGAANSRLVMQGDGNLVLYSGSGAAAWSSKTAPAAGLHLRLQDDGNLVLLTADGRPVWSRSGGHTGSTPWKLGTNQQLAVNQYLLSPNGKWKAILQGDGNFVLYGPSGAAWAVGSGASNAVLVMQGDGNLVLYAPGGVAKWSSGTAPASGGTLHMQDDGNLVIYRGDGRALWSHRSGLLAPPIRGDDYPYKNAAIDQPDPWGALTRECTSFVAWRLSQSGNTVRMNWGNATSWDETARAKGYRVDNSPKVGSVAQSDGGPGHVAWVAAVNSNGTVTIEEYNNKPYAYSVRTVPVGAFEFIHVRDVG